MTTSNKGVNIIYKVSFIQKCLIYSKKSHLFKNVGHYWLHFQKNLENARVYCLAKTQKRNLKTLKKLENAPKIAGNPGHGDVSRVVMVMCHMLSW